MNQAPLPGAIAITNDQLQQLNQRFRCKPDIYTYLDKVMNVLLPKLKNCTLQVR